MKLQVKKGTTSKRVFIFVQDSSQVDGRGLAGLLYNSSGLEWYFARDDDGNAGGTAVSLASATLGSYTSGGFKEKDAAHMPGVYEIGIPDAALAAGADSVVMMLQGAADMAPVTLEIQLVASDPNSVPKLPISTAVDLIKQNVQTFRQFTLLDADGNPVSGESANFVIDTFKGGSVLAPTDFSLVAEIGSTGTYYYLFMDNSVAGTWHIRISHPTLKNFEWDHTFIQNADGILTNADIKADAADGVDNLSSTGSYAADAATMAGQYGSDRTPLLAGAANCDATISSRAQPGDEMELEDGAITEPKFGDAAISDRVLAADVDTYQAKVVLEDDDAASRDRYVVKWFKNSQPIPSGVADATIQVTKQSDGSDLVSSVSMSDVGSNRFKYEEPTNRITAGLGYMAIVTATIDGSTRTFEQPIGRDTA